MEPDEAQKWVLARAGSAKWHETIRMAVACDDSGFLAASLRKHEEAAELPTGEVFLAAEGLADRQTGQGHRISTKAFYDLSYQIMRSL